MLTITKSISISARSAQEINQQIQNNLNDLFDYWELDPPEIQHDQVALTYRFSIKKMKACLECSKEELKIKIDLPSTDLFKKKKLAEGLDTWVAATFGASPD